MNVFGIKGVGKTKTVNEVMRYLRFRHFYTNGIFYIDLSQIKDLSEINEKIEHFEVRKDRKD